MRWRSAPPWQVALGLGFCVLCGYVAFIADDRVPLLSLVNLGFHELGHLVMYLLPVGELPTAAMGSVLQCVVPLGLAGYFAIRRRNLLEAGVCLAWASTNFQEAAVYIADAPYQALPLIGGEHDWAYILGPEQFDALDRAASIATGVRGAGMAVLVLAVGACVAPLLVDRAERRIAPTAKPAPFGRV